MDSHKHVLGRLEQSGAELVVVMGPRDDSLPGHHWIGAVLSTTGQHPNVPTLAQALADGLFCPGCSRYLAAFEPEKVSPERMAAAQASTRRAVAAMKAGDDRRSASEAPTRITKPASEAPTRITKPASETPTRITKPASETPTRILKPVSGETLPSGDAPDKARAFAMNSRLKFQRVYESARKAIEQGDSTTARLKCRAALDLLHEGDFYGPAQQSITRTLEEQLRKLDEA